MNPLATVTITVYFVGLINFSGTGGTRDVVAPLATTSIVRTPGTHAALRASCAWFDSAPGAWSAASREVNTAATVET